MKPWFEQRPDWLVSELAALDAAGIRHRRDEEAFRSGTARLLLEVEVDGLGPVPLVVTFPDLYPYFRFEVQASSLDLDHHQNPFHKNLCLLPRETNAWSPTDTVASVLATQLPKVIRTARAARPEDVVGEEVPQAEPVSVYFDAHPFSSVIVQGGWRMPADRTLGRLVVGTQTPRGERPPVPLRGAVLKVLDQDRVAIAEADAALARGFGGTEVSGMWVRVPTPILEPHPIDFLQRLFDQHPVLKQALCNPVQGGHLKLWGVVFPEEVGHRRVGDGWLFVCHFEEKLDRLNRKLSALRPPARGGT